MKQETQDNPKTGKEEQPKDQVPLPLIFCRSALFATARSMDVAPSFNEKPILTSGEWHLSYTGPLLRQQDLDVWVACLQIAQTKNLAAGIRMTISRARLLKELGIAPNGRDTQELVQKLKRLRAALLTVKGPIRTERANLLAVFDEENAGDVTNRDRIHIAFDPLFAPLLENYIAQVPNKTSFQLKQLLAKWLYRYASTCSGEFRVGVEKLREWSGNSEDLVSYDPSTKQQMERKAVSFAHFRSNLKKAANEIMAAVPGEFKTLRLERKKGEEGEGQFVIHRAERAKVTIKKPTPPRHGQQGLRKGGVVL